MTVREWSRPAQDLFCLALVFAGPAFSLLPGQSTPAATAAPPQRHSGGEDTSAQTTRSIEGKVLDKTGALVPHAVVLLKDSKSLQVRSYLVQADGSYHFFGLSTDVDYSLRAEDKDMTSKTKTVSVFDSHRKVKLNLKLVKKRAKK